MWQAQACLRTWQHAKIVAHAARPALQLHGSMQPAVPRPCSPAAYLQCAPQFVTDRHGRLVVLGEGAHAVVYHGRLQGCDVAVKVSRV